MSQHQHRSSTVTRWDEPPGLYNYIVDGMSGCYIPIRILAEIGIGTIPQR